MEQLKTWSGYFKKPVEERRQLLQQHIRELSDDSKSADSDMASMSSVLDDGGIDTAAANLMVENCVGRLALPYGVAPTFIVNGKHFVVPMCVEEASVIAAASGIAKLVAMNGGFTSKSTGNIMTGQIQLMDIEDAEQAAEKVNSHERTLIDAANRHCASMVKRGGGVQRIQARVIEPKALPGRKFLKPYVVVCFEIDVCEAMGANLINTVAEGFAPDLEELTSGRAALKILTNLCLGRLATASFRLPVKSLGWKGVDGSVVAERILEAYYFAEDDPLRATTNNKGIMNGIDAVALATGQDWRAVEAAAHAYTCVADKAYAPFAKYHLDEAGEVLVGELCLPISVGTIGGALQTHTLYKLSHKLLGNPDAQTLAQLFVCVGLAQNFAAIRALAIEGIQKGHMSLHARSVAAGAGVPQERISEVVAHMLKVGKVHKDVATEYMRASQETEQVDHKI